MIPDKLNEHLKNIQRLEGWCTHDKAVHMAELINETRPDVLVEIGVFGGRGTIAMAMTCQHIGHGRVIGIDPWASSASTEGSIGPENEEWWSKLDHEAIYKCCLSVTRSLGCEDTVTYLRMHDTEALKHFEDNSIGFLHIDSNHSEEVSCRTVRDWVPKVKPGSYLIFDDTNWPSQAKALEMLKSDLGLEFLGLFDMHDSQGNKNGEYALLKKPA